MTATKQTESKYRRVKCADCGAEQILFLRAATTVKCQVCGATMAEPTGGLSRIRGEIVGTVE